MKRKRSNFLCKGEARLDGALALFGCSNDVAAYDHAAFVKRTGELIARSVMGGADTQVPTSPAKPHQNAKREA